MNYQMHHVDDRCHVGSGSSYAHQFYFRISFAVCRNRIPIGYCMGHRRHGHRYLLKESVWHCKLAAMHRKQDGVFIMLKQEEQPKQQEQLAQPPPEQLQKELKHIDHRKHFDHRKHLDHQKHLGHRKRLDHRGRRSLLRNGFVLPSSHRKHIDHRGRRGLLRNDFVGLASLHRSANN